ncbi:hypothetical protein [Dactylosporangium sp. NPDC049140]
MPKVLVSTTRTDAGHNTRVVGGDVPRAFERGVTMHRYAVGG